MAYFTNFLSTPLCVLLAEFDNGHHARDIFSNVRHLVGIIKLIDCMLKTEVEEFALQLFELGFQFSICHLFHFDSLHSLTLHFFIELLPCCETALDREFV